MAPVMTENIVNTEIWKPVLGFEGIYEVSDNGKVKSIARVVARNNGRNLSVKEKVLRHSISVNTGYAFVLLYKNGIGYNRTVHQLVVSAFLGSKEGVVNYRDFNKLNNRLKNLEYVTQRTNADKRHLKSSSKFTGVYWSKQAKKWQAQIQHKGRQVYLGLFTNELEASKVYEDYKLEHNLV